MNILLAGGSGFIGRALIRHWQGLHNLTVVGRNINTLKSLFSNTVRILMWENLESCDPADFDVVINLVGESVSHLFWSHPVKAKILQSRIQCTQKLVSWLNKKKPGSSSVHFLSASALSIYGLYDTLPPTMNTEKTPIKIHPGFLCEVAREWENAAHTFLDEQTSLTIMRFSLVLDKSGGALRPFLRSAQCGLGMRMGSGEQPFAWISLHDLMLAIDYIIAKKILGPVNMVAPCLLTQHTFMKILCATLKRPYFLKFPARLLQLALGQMAEEMILKGQAAIPEKLIKNGFNFCFSTLNDFLNAV